VFDFRDLIDRYKDGETRIVRYLIMAGIILGAVVIAVVVFYSLPGAKSKTPTVVTAPTEFSLRSIAFNDGKPMPIEYTGEGDDRSPPLDFLNVPDGAAELVLIMTQRNSDDPPTTHWIIYGLAPDAGGLADGVEPVERPDYPVGAMQGVTSLGEQPGYHGPMPPPGSGRHRYTFTLYVLREKHEDAKPGLTRDELMELMAGKVMAQTEFVGTYKR
jgi:Raf kinase inhibitor-like YbhB/YbcL family protein